MSRSNNHVATNFKHFNLMFQTWVSIDPWNSHKCVLKKEQAFKLLTILFG